MKYQLILTEEDLNTVITALKYGLVKAIANETTYAEEYLRKALDAIKDFTIAKED